MIWQDALVINKWLCTWSTPAIPSVISLLPPPTPKSQHVGSVSPSLRLWCRDSSEAPERDYLGEVYTDKHLKTLISQNHERSQITVCLGSDQRGDYGCDLDLITPGDIRWVLEIDLGSSAPKLKLSSLCEKWKKKKVSRSRKSQRTVSHPNKRRCLPYNLCSLPRKQHSSFDEILRRNFLWQEWLNVVFSVAIFKDLLGLEVVCGCSRQVKSTDGRFQAHFFSHS